MSRTISFGAAFLSILFLSVLFLSCQSAKQTTNTSPLPSAPRISKEKLRQMLDDPRLVLIDTRVKQQWDKEAFKLPGAQHRSPWTAQEWGKELPRDRIIVTYCS